MGKKDMNINDDGDSKENSCTIDNQMHELGLLFKKIRLSKNIKQRQIERETSLTQNTVYRIESGDNPRLWTILTYCNYVGIDLCNIINKFNIETGCKTYEETKIKKTLKEANRYLDISIILSNITKLNCHDYSVFAYEGEDGKIKRRVDGKDVSNEAEKLLKFIDGEITIEDICLFDHFSNLYKYVKSCTDTLLHNYSIDISHGIEPRHDMEDIRSWLILDNLILTLDLDGDWTIGDWTIPVGWRKEL